MQKYSRANAPRFRVGPILSGAEPNRYSTIETLTTISEAESGQRAKPAAVSKATLATYLSSSITAKKSGRGAKVASLPAESLFDAVSPVERHKIVMAQIRTAGVPDHAVDNARSAIEFALRAKPVDANTKPYGLIKTIAKRYANFTKRELGFPLSVPDDAYQGTEAQPISTMSLDDLFGPDGGDPNADNPEIMTVFNPLPSNTDPMLTKFTPEELSQLLLLTNEIGPRHRPFLSHLLRGESPVRAGELCGLDETTSRMAIRRIREVMKNRA